MYIKVKDNNGIIKKMKIKDRVSLKKGDWFIKKIRNFRQAKVVKPLIYKLVDILANIKYPYVVEYFEYDINNNTLKYRGSTDYSYKELYEHFDIDIFNSKEEAIKWLKTRLKLANQK